MFPWLFRVRLLARRGSAAVQGGKTCWKPRRRTKLRVFAAGGASLVPRLRGPGCDLDAAGVCESSTRREDPRLRGVRATRAQRRNAPRGRSADALGTPDKQRVRVSVAGAREMLEAGCWEDRGPRRNTRSHGALGCRVHFYGRGTKGWPCPSGQGTATVLRGDNVGV